VSEQPFPTHKELELENFTAFERAKLSFVPGVNAIIGENGTGKTHILKVLYAVHLSWLRYGHPQLVMVFQLDQSNSQLIRNGGLRRESADAGGVFGDTTWRISAMPPLIESEDPEISSNATPSFGVVLYSGDIPEQSSMPVFIPAIDMMAHTKGFVSTFDNYRIDFDLTHREIVSLLLSPEKRELDEPAMKLVADLTAILGGTLELQGERFYLATESTRLPMPSVAEGLRKIATLIRLVQTGWLGPGSTLFWDEPEVNLNPILMDEVVGAILALSRAGVQVFLATHSYVILKELDLQLGNDEARFISLRHGPNGTEVSSFSSFSELVPNAILDQYSSLYDRELARATGRKIVREQSS